MHFPVLMKTVTENQIMNVRSLLPVSALFVQLFRVTWILPLKQDILKWQNSSNFFSDSLTYPFQKAVWWGVTPAALMRLIQGQNNHCQTLCARFTLNLPHLYIFQFHDLSTLWNRRQAWFFFFNLTTDSALLSLLCSAERKEEPGCRNEMGPTFSLPCVRSPLEGSIAPSIDSVQSTIHT